MCYVVDHQCDVRRGDGILGQLRDGRPVNGRVPHDQITKALAVQPQRLRQGVAEQAREAGYGQRFGKHVTHPDGFGRQPDRLAGRSAHQVRSIGRQRGRVDHSERRIKMSGGGAQPLDRHARSSDRSRVRGEVDRERLQGGLGRVTVPVDQVVQRQAVEDGDHLPGQHRLRNVPRDVSDLRDLGQAEQNAVQVPAVLEPGDLARLGIPQYRRGDLVQNLVQARDRPRRFPSRPRRPGPPIRTWGRPG